MISWLEKNRGVSWTITLVIFVGIFYVSSLSFPPPPVGPPSLSATVYHISIFFILAVFLFISILNRKLEMKKIILAIFVTAIYAALDELHQFFVPGRFCSFNDFLLDFTGIILASLVYLILIFKKIKIKV